MGCYCDSWLPSISLQADSHKIFTLMKNGRTLFSTLDSCIISPGARAHPDKLVIVSIWESGLRAAAPLSSARFKVRQVGSRLLTAASLLCMQLRSREAAAFRLFVATADQKSFHRSASTMLAEGKRGHCTLLKVTALPKMGPLQS